MYESYQGVLIALGVIYFKIINFVELQAELTSLKGTFTSEIKKINIFKPGQGIKEEIKKKIVPYEFEVTPQSLERIK